ncbi:hypothetical protein ACQ4PT_027403 [Festuca glaucescens]
MAEVWELPDPSTVANTGKEWVLHLIDGKTEFDRAKILMLLWRIWHVRNEVVHHKAPPPVEASKCFLCSYLESIATIKYYPQADGIKGKEPMIMWESQLKKKSDIEEAIETNPELLEKTIEQGDVLAHVLEKEKNGYVWCVGMGPSPGRLGIPGGQKLKSTKLQMAEEETKDAWWANDVLREHVEEIREETKSKIDGLMEEIDLLKWMMAQTIATNNKTKSIEREPEDPEGSVGESYAIEDQYELDDEEERV